MTTPRSVCSFERTNSPCRKAAPPATCVPTRTLAKGERRKSTQCTATSPCAPARTEKENVEGGRWRRRKAGSQQPASTTGSEWPRNSDAIMTATRMHGSPWKKERLSVNVHSVCRKSRLRALKGTRGVHRTSTVPLQAADAIIGDGQCRPPTWSPPVSEESFHFFLFLALADLRALRLEPGGASIIDLFTASGSSPAAMRRVDSRMA